jgi:hypothetical protein
VQSHVRFNRVLKKVPEVRLNRVPKKFPEKVPEKLFFFLLFLCVCTLHTCKDKTLRLLGIPPELICVPPSCRCHGCVSLYYPWIFPNMPLQKFVLTQTHAIRT